MVHSLIAQLVCDYDFITCANATGLLPEDATLFCIIDSIIYYERQAYVDPMLDVIGDILGLAADKSLKTALKVFVTGPLPTMCE